MKRKWCCVRFCRNGFGKIITICWFLLGKIFVGLYRPSAKLALLKVNVGRLVFPGLDRLLIKEGNLIIIVDVEHLLDNKDENEVGLIFIRWFYY